jgi:hypothetical protein
MNIDGDELVILDSGRLNKHHGHGFQLPKFAIKSSTSLNDIFLDNFQCISYAERRQYKLSPIEGEMFTVCTWVGFIMRNLGWATLVALK